MNKVSSKNIIVRIVTAMLSAIFLLGILGFGCLSKTYWSYQGMDPYTASVLENGGATLTPEAQAYLQEHGDSSSTPSTPATPAHVHNYTATVTREATCSEEGVMTYTCTGCGNSYTEAIPKTEHSWVETVITPATCSTEGEVKKVCSVCGAEVIEKIPVDPEVHDYEEVIISEPTCTIDGKAKKVCKGCGAETDEYVIPAAGHNYTSKVTTEPTCTEKGVKTFTCTKCGDTYTEDIPALGHDETSEYVYALKIGDFVFDGKTVYTCSRCGAVREEADPNSYPLIWFVAICAVAATIILAVVVLIAVKKNKKDKEDAS